MIRPLAYLQFTKTKQRTLDKHKELCLSKAINYMRRNVGLVWGLVWMSYTEYYLTVNHTYTSIGDYNVTFLAENAIHYQLIQVSIHVTDIDCFIPEIKIKGTLFINMLYVYVYNDSLYICICIYVCACDKKVTIGELKQWLSLYLYRK